MYRCEGGREVGINRIYTKYKGHSVFALFLFPDSMNATEQNTGNATERREAKETIRHAVNFRCIVVLSRLNSWQRCGLTG